jgi:hypothetical protein
MRGKIMPVLMESVIMADGDLHLHCNACGKEIPDAEESYSYWSQLDDDHYIAESGYYCDDDFPRCFHPNCQ